MIFILFFVYSGALVQRTSISAIKHGRHFCLQIRSCGNKAHHHFSQYKHYEPPQRTPVIPTPYHSCTTDPEQTSSSHRIIYLNDTSFCTENPYYYIVFVANTVQIWESEGNLLFNSYIDPKETGIELAERV